MTSPICSIGTLLELLQKLSEGRAHKCLRGGDAADPLKLHVLAFDGLTIGYRHRWVRI